MIGFQCPQCRNFWGDGKCNAFEKGIPVKILQGEFDHTRPHEGDNGVRYALLGEDWAEGKPLETEVE